MIVVAITTLGLSGCAYLPENAIDIPEAWSAIEIESTPFFPQERFQCGPAALTTLLSFSGVEVSLQGITSLTYIPARKGALRAELLATARSFGRIPYEIDGTLSALAAELEAGRPVLVLQNLGVSWFPRWHYAVVVGFDPVTEKVILRSGTERRRVTGLAVFLRTWQRSGYWSFVLLTPGELPANPERNRYLGAVANLEAAGQLPAAMQGWAAALGYWPNDALALFGKANTAFSLGRYEDAEEAYRFLLSEQPGHHAARNNLAFALVAQDNIEAAYEQIRTLLDRVDPDDPLRSEYEASLREVELLRSEIE